MPRLSHSDMRLSMLHLFAYSLVCSILIGCDGLNDDIAQEYNPIAEEDSPFSGFNIKKISSGIENFFVRDGVNCSAQGFAVAGKTAYRIYDTGACQTFDISDIEAPEKISSFILGSGNMKNHGNCAQFHIDPGEEPLLYVSGLYGNCYIERIHPEGAELVQRLTLPAMEVYNLSKTMNIICGDDGNLWAFGNALSDNTLSFAKLRRPDITEGDITLSGADILDYWEETDYVYEKSVWQGGMVYKGLLYFVFGAPGSHRHIAIYDTTTHEKISDLDLDGLVREEPEDCDMVDGKIVLTVNGGTGFYIIDLQQNKQ